MSLRQTSCGRPSIVSQYRRDGQCVVYYFGAGQGGGPEANAQRWADQFEQPDGGSSRDVLVTAQSEAGGMPALLVEVTGTYKEGGVDDGRGRPRDE